MYKALPSHVIHKIYADEIANMQHMKTARFCFHLSTQLPGLAFAYTNYVSKTFKTLTISEIPWYGAMR